MLKKWSGAILRKKENEEPTKKSRMEETAPQKVTMRSVEETKVGDTEVEESARRARHHAVALSHDPAARADTVSTKGMTNMAHLSIKRTPDIFTHMKTTHWEIPNNQC